MVKNNMVLVSKNTLKILTLLFLTFAISFVGIFEVAVLKKITGIYQLASIVIIILIVIYLLVPLTVNSFLDLLVTSIIISFTTIFVYIHNSILWSSGFSGLSITVLPLSVIIKLGPGNNVIRPVLEIDWGQIVIMLVLLKIWISLLKYLRSLKF